MKILNLQAGIGGNRKHWVGDITAVECDPAIADVYKILYPDDTVIIGDAYKYVEEYHAEFDFIWGSPPCPSHGQYRHNVGVIGKGFAPIMPDMMLYSLIIFLQTYFKGKWVVENVKPYYTPLIPPTFELHRHLFWSNFTVHQKKFTPAKIRSKNKISDFENGSVVASSKIKNKRQVLRNCVDSKLGKHIFDSAFLQQNDITLSSGNNLAEDKIISFF